MTASPEQLLSAKGARTMAIARPNGSHRPAETPARGGPPTRLRVMTLAECSAARPIPYLVKGLVRPGDVVILFGPPGAGKSVLAPYLAHAIATGRTIFGRRVRQMPVIYASPEDGPGMILRGAALRHAYGDAPGLLLIPQPLNLMTLPPAAPDNSQMPRDAQDLRAVAEHFRAGLIVLDTVAAAFPGLRENEPDAMDHVVRVARFLAESGAAVVLVHHAAKGGGTTPRGHGRLEGDADTTLLIETAEGGGLRTTRIGKNRSGSALGTLAFTIRAESLGTDDDGDPITAPVAVEAEEGAATSPRKAAPKLPEAAALLLRELTGLAADGAGEMTKPEPGMPMVRAIPRDVLRARLIRVGWFAPDQISAVLPGSEKPTRSGYRAENKALNTLKLRGLAGFNRDAVWLA